MNQISSITQLDNSTVQTRAAFLVQFLQEAFPTLDLQPGRVCYELLIRPAAILGTLDQTNMQLLLQSASLLNIAANPALADTATVNQILSNYNLSLNAGAVATGALTIVLSANQVTTILATTTFTANGMTFTPVQSFTGVPAGQVGLAANEVNIVDLGNNTYSFIITVQASAVGSTGNISTGTFFDMTPLNGNITAVYASSDFTGGLDSQSVTQLVNQMQTTLTPKVMGSRTAIKSLLQTQFPQLIDLSIIGFGDPELQRDKHNILGISPGGKTDIYVRTAPTPQQITVVKTATLDDISLGRWNLTFTATEYPGCYGVSAIQPLDQTTIGSYQVINIIRGLDLTNVPAGLEIPEAIEGVYSAYQTLGLSFIDTTNLTGLAQGATRQYNVTVLIMPNVGDIQNYINQPLIKQVNGDCLVRAPIPCHVKIELNLRQLVNGVALDLATIQQAIANEINTLTFDTGQLQSSIIVNAVNSVVGSSAAVVLPLNVYGRVYLPDGTIHPLYSSRELFIPVLPALSTSNRTVFFYASPDDVAITIISNRALSN